MLADWSVMSGTQIQERPEVREKEADKGPELFHYVDKNKMVESAVLGTYVEALCGERFPVTQVPKPDSPICPACQEIYNTFRDE
jgi:Protein of unknown function (DUF3039)